MARILKIFACLFGLLILIAVVAPFVVPADKIKNGVLAQIAAKTGRTITMERASFSIFPTLGLHAESVKIGNPAWAGGGNMADIKTLKVGLELMPMLHGQYRLKELTLDKPVIILISQQGKANWEMPNAAAAETAPAPKSKPEASGHKGMPDLHLGKISISDGTVTFKDNGKIQTIPNINLTLKASDFNSKAELKMSALYGGKKLRADVSVDKPSAFADGRTTPGHLKAGYGGIDFNWEGTLAMPRSGVLTLTGKAEIPSLDTTELSQKETKAAPSGKASAPAQATGASRWSDASLSLDALSKANADLSLSIGKLKLPKTTLEDIALKVQLAGGALKIQAAPIKAYGGTIDFSAHATARETIDIAFAVHQTQAEPFLHDFASFDRISGTVEMQTKLAMSGGSERALIHSLSGSGNVMFKNGKLRGVNLAALVRNVTGIQNPQDASTDFSELSASYTIAQGIVTTNDIRLASPLLRVSGAGTVDLPNWQDHLLIKPTLVASLEGQGGKDASGISVPVRVEGPVDHPRYIPDLQAALQENLKDPEKLKQNVDDLKKTILNGNGLQNLLR